MLVKETPGAPDFRAERGQGVEAGELGAAAVKRLDDADVAEQVVSVLDHIVIEFGEGILGHKQNLLISLIAIYYTINLLLSIAESYIFAKILL
ncbi:MAG TPA: hypothetical protein H9745_04285 [Candidatus Agathobaculum stercoravium]|nr:hypothetical protein [Candidatus Agathobaculum stercoravium]